METKKRLIGWLCLLCTGLLAVGLSACSSDEKEDKSDDPSGIIDERPKGNMNIGSSEEVTVNEENYVVEAAGFTIELNPCIVNGDMTLSVAKATETPSMLDESDKVTAVNLQLGNLSEFNGVAKIHIPVNFGNGQILVSARWNEGQHDWEPALCEYDSATGDAVIWTDKPGTYGVSVVSESRVRTRGNSTNGAFIVSRANTRFAGINGNKYQFTHWEDPPLEVLEALLSDLLGGENDITKEGDLITQGILDTKAIFGDISYPLLEELGLKNSLLKNTADFMGKLAVVATFYQKLRAVYSGKFDQADAMTLKSCLDFIVGKATSLCKSSAMNLGMVSVAVIDYTLNKFAEEAWKGRKDMYKKAYELYYSKGEDGYRSFWDWYDLFWPAFTKEGMTSRRLGILIDAYVEKYCSQFWEDEKRIAYYMSEATGTGWTGGGGLNEGIKKEVSEEYRQYLYGEYEKLPKVFDAICDKLKAKQFDIMKDRMMKYAEQMNKMVTLHLKDISVKDNQSAYAGYKVKFKKLPLSIVDPFDWECVLDEKGEGKIEFRLFAYAAADVKPELIVVSPNDEVKLTIPLKDIDTGVNIVEFGEQKTGDIKIKKIQMLQLTTSFKDHVKGKEGDWYTDAAPVYIKYSDYSMNGEKADPDYKVQMTQGKDKLHIDITLASSDYYYHTNKTVSFDITNFKGDFSTSKVENLTYKMDHGYYFTYKYVDEWGIDQEYNDDYGRLKDLSDVTCSFKALPPIGTLLSPGVKYYGSDEKVNIGTFQYGGKDNDAFLKDYTHKETVTYKDKPDEVSTREFVSNPENEVKLYIEFFYE